MESGSSCFSSFLRSTCECSSSASNIRNADAGYFIEEVRRKRIDLAADYLLMAAWLAFLKSRLLLPPDPAEEGPSGEELAAHLAFQLERLQAMRDVSARLMARDQKGRDFFVRGQVEVVERRKTISYTATLLDLMQGYARIRTRDEFRPFVMDRESVMTMEEALDRMRHLEREG